MSTNFSKLRFVILLIFAVLMILGMLRLGIWQLERSSQKQSLLDKVTQRSLKTRTTLGALSSLSVEEHRFTKVNVSGYYMPDKSVLIDNQVHKGMVGYLVFTPLMTNGGSVMVNRGWVSVGDSRDDLPTIATPLERVELIGRLNTAPPQPPLWDDDYSVYNGLVWAYLPLELYGQQMKLNVMPLVLELAPEDDSSSKFQVAWSDINDEWVAKHKGYAFQWFAMALAFFIACLILVIRRLNRISE